MGRNLGMHIRNVSDNLLIELNGCSDWIQLRFLMTITSSHISISIIIVSFQVSSRATERSEWNILKASLNEPLLWSTKVFLQRGNYFNFTLCATMWRWRDAKHAETLYNVITFFSIKVTIMFFLLFWNTYIPSSHTCTYSGRS